MKNKTYSFDRKFRNARIWSNDELRKISTEFTGDVCNVSAWRDEDKEGNKYKDYFTNASSYSITNYENTEARGFQSDIEGQIILDLEKELEEKLAQKFDVVFNHTTFEHIFDCWTAFKNLCLLSKDIVIIVVPFMQETHADYGDYWRYTPQGLDKLFQRNGFETVYYNCNDSDKDSIYLFFVASRNKSRWTSLQTLPDNRVGKIYSEFIGTKIINNSILDRIINKLRTLTQK